MVECVAALVGDAAGRPTVRTSDSLDIRIGGNRLGWKDFFFPRRSGRNIGPWRGGCWKEREREEANTAGQ
jgi:hypothetical protein